MRQVGVLAAAGLIALRDGPAGMIERLAEDHANARLLADGIAGMPGVVGLDPHGYAPTSCSSSCHGRSCACVSWTPSSAPGRR